MNKTFLVALREYVENLRTKAFWIGIAAFPVIIVIAIVAGRLMESAKDVRRYAIVDHSQDQWLSRAVEERAKTSEFERILKSVTQLKNLSRGPAALLADLRKRRQSFKGTDIQKELLDLLIETVERAASSKKIDQDAVKQRFFAWFASKTPAELAGLKTDLDRDRYRRITAESSENAEKALNKKLQAGKIFAYFVIGKDPVASNEGCRYVSNNLTDSGLKSWFSTLATEVVREKRISALHLTAKQADSIRQRFSFEARKVSKKTGKAEEVQVAEKAHQFAPVAFVYLLWIAVMMATQMLLTNTIEEKSNRIIEVLLSSVSPLQLMTGKIFGIAATGLTLVLFWALCGIGAIAILPMVSESFSRFELSAIVGDPIYLASFVGYFLGGYLFFAALIVGIGSVCNSLKEAQNLQQPIFIALIVPLLAMVPVVNDPNGTLARVLTYIPPFTPFLMMNRAGGPPPAIEYLLTTALILVSILLSFWGSAKVFRIGILMTGKPPKIREILRWLRAPVGAVAVMTEVAGEVAEKS